MLQKKISTKPKAKAPVGKSKFAQYRAKMRQQKEIVVAGSPVTVTLVEPAEEVKTFDARFFSVSSPIRSPAFHCEGKSIEMSSY